MLIKNFIKKQKFNNQLKLFNLKNLYKIINNKLINKKIKFKIHNNQMIK